jgi:hypothetical protein
MTCFQVSQPCLQQLAAYLFVHNRLYSNMLKKSLLTLYRACLYANPIYVLYYILIH